MTDSQFLSWLRDRLIFVYGESPNVDFVLRLERIVKEMENRELVANAINKMLGGSDDPTR